MEWLCSLTTEKEVAGRENKAPVVSGSTGAIPVFHFKALENSVSKGQWLNLQSIF